MPYGKGPGLKAVPPTPHTKFGPTAERSTYQFGGRTALEPIRENS